MSWVDEDGQEFFDLSDSADRERFDAAVDALEAGEDIDDDVPDAQEIV